MSRVLVVDDEAPIRRTMRANLEARGYVVDLAESGEAALELVTRHPEVVLLDLGLPGIDGLAVIKALRRWTRVPIVVLSAGDGERDKVAALDAGADYVAKPFGMDELLARLRAALRRSAPSDRAARVVTPDFTIDLGSRQILDGRGRPVRITPTEWHIVEVLVRNRNKLVSQRTLLHEVWGPGYDDHSGHLRVHVAHLRRKIEPDHSHPQYLLTEPGMGHRFNVDLTPDG